MAQNLLLGVMTALSFGAAAEGLARLAETPRPAPPPVADYITRWAEGESEFYTVNSAATGWPPWEDYNSEGVRDREHVLQKPPGVRRVVALGDSVTLGFGLPPEDAYPQLLQDRLDALGQPVEVLNVSLFGWATGQERVAYHRIARKYRPDLVLLGVCLNDIAEMQNNLARPPWLVGALYRRSALVRRVVGAQQREIGNIEELFQQTPHVQEAFGRFFAELDRLHREVQRDGSVLAVLVFPFRGQVAEGAPPPRVQEEIASFCRARGLPVLDLRPPLLELGEAAFSDHVHLTAEGTARVADAIAESGLIPTGEPSGAALPDPAVGDSIPELTRALTDPSPRVRRATCWALGPFGAAAAPALPGLVAALDDPDPGVRAGAAWALGKVGPAAREFAAAPLIQRLADANANVRRRAGDALVRVGPECDDCLPALVEIVAAPDSPGRAPAARALGALGPAARPALAALVGALRDSRPDVRGHAAGALGRMGWAAQDAVGPLVALMDDPVSGRYAIDAIAAIGPGAAPAVPRLCRALHDPSGSVRWRAAHALGLIGPPARMASADLAAVLGDQADNVRLAAAQALARIDADAAAILPALARALSDGDSRVRAAAAHGLGRLGPRAHAYLPALLAAAHDPDAMVRAAAVRALRHVGLSAESRSWLSDLAQRDPNDGVRTEARKTLRPQVRPEP